MTRLTKNGLTYDEISPILSILGAREGSAESCFVPTHPEILCFGIFITSPKTSKVIE